MLVDRLFDEYIREVASEPQVYLADYDKTTAKVASSSAIYNGKPVPFLYQPMFFSSSDLELFKKLGSDLMTILNKVIAEYVESPTFRKKFGFPELLEELILTDHGYDLNIPMARLDIFYGDDGNFKFCELNTDGSSGMNESNVLDRTFLEAASIKKMKEKYSIDYLELLDSWVTASTDNFRQYDPAAEKPNVAIVDWEGGSTASEFEEFRKAYAGRDYRAEIIDPRKLRYRNGKLSNRHDTRVDLIYRRLVTGELIARAGEVPDLIDALRGRAVCVVGPIRSQLVHDKIIFEVLHDPDTMSLLTSGERSFIEAHIPITGRLESGVNRKELGILEEKDRYVLKPRDMYASRGVHLGQDFSPDDWKRKVRECQERNYLFQEFCQPFRREMVFFKDGSFKTEIFNIITGLYMYNEKLAGMYTRVSTGNIISSSHGCYTLPNLIVA